MQKSLDQKLANLHRDPSGAKDFILADAKDADMATGLAATGVDHATGKRRSLADYRDQIRAVVIDVPIMVRVTEMPELAIAAAYDPPPILIELDEGMATPEVLDDIHAAGTKVFTNVFVSADLAWLFDSDVSQFPHYFDLGLDALQTEFPHIALHAIGRAEPL
jgi:hypothetical protein